MTKQQAAKAVADMGLVCKWSVEWQEFTVDYRVGDARRTPHTSYHTQDVMDAIGTAKAMSNWKPTRLCSACGGRYPLDFECQCFDNGCQ